MVVRIGNIRAAHWQPKLSAAGQVVEGLDDIAQCIAIILTTPKGSDPHRPEFGSDCWKYIDLPVNQAAPHLIREAISAIEQWETRAIPVRIVPTPANGKIGLQVIWRLKDGTTERTTEVSP